MVNGNNNTSMVGEASSNRAHQNGPVTRSRVQNQAETGIVQSPLQEGHNNMSVGDDEILTEEFHDGNEDEIDDVTLQLSRADLNNIIQLEVNRAVNGQRQSFTSTAPYRSREDDAEWRRGELRKDTAKDFRAAIPVYKGQNSLYAFNNFFQKSHDYFNYIKASESEKLDVLMMKLGGAARSWWSTISVGNANDPNSITTFSEARTAMRKRFLTNITEYNVYRQLISLRQGTRTVTEYAQAFQELTPLLLEPMREREMVIHFLNGLNDKVRESLSRVDPCDSNLETVINAAVHNEQYHYSMATGTKKFQQANVASTDKPQQKRFDKNNNNKRRN